MAGEETTVRTSWADESEDHDEEISCPEGWVTPETRPLAEPQPQPQQKPSEQAPVRAWATVPASSQPAAAEATAAVEEAVAPAQEFPSLGEAASPTKPEPAEQRPPQRYQRPSQQQHYDRPPRRDFREGRSPRGEFVRTERPQNPVPENPPFEAYVGNLPYDVRDEELKRFFVERGECVVKEVRLLFDRATRRPKGFGYVTFGDRKSLVDALGLSGAELLNRRIRVDVATPDRERERDRDREHDRDRDRDRGSRFGDRSWGSSGDRRPSPRDFGRDRDRDRAPPAQHQQQEQQEPPAERKKLELTPRSVEAPVGGVAEKPRTRPDPFGGAKPRDEAEVERRKAKEREAREKAEAEAKAKAADAQKKAAAEAVASAAAAAAAAAATTAVKPATVKPAAQQPSRPAPKPAATTKSGRDPRNPWGLGAKQDEKKKAANKNPFDALGDD